MAEASDTKGVVHKNGSATLMARIVGADGTTIAAADISSAKYTIYELSAVKPDLRTAVAGHTDVALTVNDVVFAVKNDVLWTVDATGYNFAHTLDVSTSPAFGEVGKTYLVEFSLTPNAGQVILLRFRLEAI